MLYSTVDCTGHKYQTVEVVFYIFRNFIVLVWFFLLKSSSTHLADDSSVMTSLTRTVSGLWFHNLILFEFLLCSAATVALGGLLVWHARLIHYAETSIELHINKSEAKRQQKKGLVSVICISGIY